MAQDRRHPPPVRPPAARILSGVLNPSLLAAAGFLVLVLGAPDPAGRSARAAVLALALGPGLATGYALFLRTTGRVPSLFIPSSRARMAPMLLGGASCGAGTWALHAVDAPPGALGLMAGLGAQAPLLVGLTLRWRVSLHAAGAWSVAVALCSTFGAAGGPAVAAAAAVSWARVREGAHSAAQVGAGAVVGGGCTFLGLLWSTFPGGFR